MVPREGLRVILLRTNLRGATIKSTLTRLALGGLASSAGFVSREWAAIQSTTSFLEGNFPKWCTVPFGQTICTRQNSPSHTSNKAVQRAPIKPSMIRWMRLTSLLVRRSARLADENNHLSQESKKSSTRVATVEYAPRRTGASPPYVGLWPPEYRWPFSYLGLGK